MAARLEYVEVGTNTYRILNLPPESLQKLRSALINHTVVNTISKVTFEITTSNWFSTQKAVIVERLGCMLFRGPTSTQTINKKTKIRIKPVKSSGLRCVQFKDVPLPSGLSCVNPETILGYFTPDQDISISLEFKLGTHVTTSARVVPAMCFVKHVEQEDGSIDYLFCLESYGMKTNDELLQEAYTNLQRQIVD